MTFESAGQCDDFKKGEEDWTDPTFDLHALHVLLLWVL